MNEGKTYWEICHIAHVSPRDIKPIAKEYERKKRLETNIRIGKKIQTKKPSLSSQAFILYQEGKKISEVKVLLDIPFKKAMIYWVQYLKSLRMFECFEFYQECQNDLPSLLLINNFIKRNNIDGKNIVNVLRTANDIINLNQMVSNLKTEINRLEGKRMSLSYYFHLGYSLQPLPLNKPNYNYYRY